MIFQYFLIALFVPEVATYAGQFDLAEYRRVSYDATIGENFLWFVPDLDLREVTADNIDAFEKQITDNIPDEKLSNFILITNKGGQKFACSLPEVEELKAPTPARSSKNPKVYGEALAASFYVQKCIKLRERNSWWSYTLCRGRTVEQTHGDQGEEGYVKNILGIFDGGLTMPSYQESTEDRLLYIEESYSSGTFCDVNQEPRKTTVRYECDSQLSTNEAYVSSLVEVVPCQYLMIVKVGTLCHFPEFLPVTLANTKKIGCQPYLNKKDVRGLLERQLKVKRKTHEAEEKFSLTKKEFQSASRRYTAMTKSQRDLHVPDLMKKLNAEMDYRAAQFNLLVGSLELEGEIVTETKGDHMWKLLTTADNKDFLFYSNHDSIEDENRAHLWYYFNDPSWPKDQFPKDIVATAIQNAYIEEVQKNLKGKYVFDDNGQFVEGLTTFLKTGEVDLETNLVIPAREIYEDILTFSSMDSIYKYPWRNSLFLFFHNEDEGFEEGEEEDEETVESILEAIMKPPKEYDYFPMGNVAKRTISLLLDEIYDDLIDLSMNGQNSETLYGESELFKKVYNVLDIVPYKKSEIKMIDGEEYKFRVSLKKDVLAKFNLYLEYLDLLAPLYKMLSIRWFQRQTPKYFHESPPGKDHLKSSQMDDYKFHYNLANDMAFFAQILQYTTIVGIKDFEKWRDGKRNSLTTARSIEKALKTKTFESNKNATKVASRLLYEKIGPFLVSEARKSIWERKVEDYKTKFWAKDHKLRKQAQALAAVMKDILETKDDKGAFVAVAGKSGKKAEEKLNDLIVKKLSKIESVADLDDGTLQEQKSSKDEDFFDLEDIQEVLDLLEKAGLAKKDGVQIDFLETDGEDPQNAELQKAVKSLFEEDQAKSFQDSEKAYLKKVLENLEEKMKAEEEKEEKK